jgi:hypothetical protein
VLSGFSTIVLWEFVLSGFSTIFFGGSLCCHSLVLLFLWEFVLSGFSTIVLWEFVLSGFSTIVFVGVCVVRV